MRARRLLAMALVVVAAYAQTAAAANLRDLSEQLDKLDADEFRAAIDKADACVRSRDFSCAETQLKKAAKVATGAKAKKTLADSQQRLANERQLVAQEEERRRRAEEERAERERLAEEREERRREREEARREREEREEREERSASASSMPSLNNFGGLDTINKAMRDGQRQIAAAQAARAEEQRRAREEERRRAAEEERDRRRAAEDARERRRAAEDDRRRAAAEEERRRAAAEEERRQAAAAERSRQALAQAQGRPSSPSSRTDANAVQVASNRPASSQAYRCVTRVHFDQGLKEWSATSRLSDPVFLSVQQACAKLEKRTSEFAAAVDRGEVRGYPRGKVKSIDACALMPKDDSRVGLYVNIEEPSSSPCDAPTSTTSK